MKLRRASGTLGLAALAVIASPFATAADLLGGYIGGNLGVTRYHFDEARILNSARAPGAPLTSTSDDDRDTGFKLYGGYRVSKNWAVEAGYFDLGKYELSGITATGTVTGNM